MLTSQSANDSSSLLQSIRAALDKGDVAAAQRLCDDRLALAPDDADAHRYLGQIHAASGNRLAAQRAAQQACDLAPDDPRVWSDLGRVWAQEGAFLRSIECFTRAVEIDPRYADGWHNLGTAQKQLGRLEEAFEALKRALLLDHTRADSYLTLGNLLVDTDQLEEALVCFERAAHHDPTMAKARSRLAQELSQHGRVNHAESLFREALTLDPDHVDGWLGLGRTLEDLGQAESALGCYLNVLRRQPGHGLALGQYLSLVKDEMDQTEALSWVAHARRALAREDTPDEAKALVGYGLTKYADRRGQYHDAAQAGIAANAARRRKAGPLDRAALQSRVDGIISTYTEDFFAARRHYGIGTDQPVFIVGLPRSGTTLTEQILSAHPLLHGAGELSDLAALATRSLTDSDDLPWQAAARLEDEMTSRRYAHQYLDGLRRGAPRGRLRISDKQPLNFFHLAFTALLFPQARVIHCKRGARDNALSIWMENFNLDQRYATDFDDLAYFLAQERRLMAHWQCALPLQILDVQYEEVVADLEGQARRLIEFLGAPWDECCLNFHQQDRAVQTPSRWQVRQPIYTKSVGRWRHYRDYLPGLESAFAEVV